MSISIDSALAADYTSSASAAASTGSTSSSSSLNMDDFLQILSAELQYQDPMEPTNNSEYMAQMAQFSLLEQVESLSKQISFSSASSSVGQNVLYSLTDSSGNTTVSSGTVDAVDISSGSPAYLVNGQWLTQSEISGFYQSPASSDSSTGSDSGSTSGTDGSTAT